MKLSDDFLDEQRLIGDAIADEVVKEIFSSEKKSSIYQNLANIKKNEDIKKSKLPDFLKKYFTEQAIFPNWANEKKMENAFQLFEKNITEVMGVLGFLSLPYCYAAAKGVQVLYFSEKIRNNTYRRLVETAQFVLDVMDKEGFQENGRGWASLLKVRLMHATIRYHLKKSKEWNQSWGLPINQEDMAGTNLAFSLITLRGLRKTGIGVSTSEAEDFIHFWNIIGDRLGMKNKLLPKNNREAFWLDKRIAERHFQPSEAGKYLTQALLQTLEQQSENTNNFPKGFAINYMRFLLGEKNADILDLPKEGWNESFGRVLQLKTWTETWLGIKFEEGANFIQLLRKELEEQPVDFIK